VAKLVEAVGGITHAQKTAIDYAERAIVDLSVLAEGETKQTLATLARFASRRES
jgi:geranylgeranyl pyrophosphate synthase